MAKPSNSTATSRARTASAQILKFTGRWEGRFEPAHDQGEAHLNALNDARQIIAAKREANNWMSRLLLALLSVMDEEQRTTLEFAIACCPSEEDTRQVLAVVRLANSGKEHRQRVLAAIEALSGRGAR